MAEKSGVDPMLETIIRGLRSGPHGGRALPLGDFFLRDPDTGADGSLRFIMNCAGSVRGKNEKSSKGKRNRLTTTMPMSTNRIATGRFRTTPMTRV